MNKIVRRLLAFAYIFLYIVSSAQTNRKIDSLYKLLQTTLPDEKLCSINVKLGALYENMGYYDSTHKYAGRGFSISKKIKKKTTIASSANYLAHYFSYSGQHDSAFFYYDISFKVYTELKDSSSIAGLYNNLGIIYVKEGNFSKALDNYYKSLKLKEQLHDTIGWANACQNIGNLYSETSDTANCIKYHRRALNLRILSGDSSGISNSYVAIGLYYLKLKDFKNAIAYLERSYKIASRIGDEESIAIISYNMGNVLFMQGKHSESEKYFLVALEMARKNNIIEGISTCLKALGNLKEIQKDYKSAARYYEEALDLAKEVQILDLETNISENLSNIYEKLGDFKSAFKYHKTWIKLKDSLYSSDNIKKLASAEIKYEHEKEKLLQQAEEKRKEEENKQKNIRKNIIIICSVIFLVLVSVFAFVLFTRLKENRKQKAIIEQQNSEILDSIKYAKQIQNTLFTNRDFINAELKENFILFKPKDIVSGDFYWATSVTGSLLQVTGSEQETNNKKPITNNQSLFYLAVCDSTGHGVPGAFMSLLNIGFLNEAIKEKNILEPNKVFDYVRNRLIESISKDGQKDGFDGVLICFNKTTGKITYASANNAPVLVSEGKLHELEKDKMPVGKGEKTQTFTLYDINYKKGDKLYIYTDGYADQFGGPKGKKFKYKALNDNILENSTLDMEKQAGLLETNFHNWKGMVEQVDDVCIVGIQL